MKLRYIKPQFVNYIPEQVNDGLLYISERHKTAVHKCCCGCGHEVITALTPADWRLRKEGELVTLHPSIGNWNFDCRSHYWIRRNQIVWAGSMTDEEIALAQRHDREGKERYIEAVNKRKEAVNQQYQISPVPPPQARASLLDRAWLALTRWRDY